jgi:hypothetical protein
VLESEALEFAAMMIAQLFETGVIEPGFGFVLLPVTITGSTSNGKNGSTLRSTVTQQPQPFVPLLKPCTVHVCKPWSAHLYQSSCTTFVPTVCLSFFVQPPDAIKFAGEPDTVETPHVTRMKSPYSSALDESVTAKS